MGLRVNTNIAALNAYRNLSVTDGQMSKSLEKLSSGFRINRAADDAAGLAISEGLRSQIGGLKVAVRNTQDGISVVQTAEGALTETHSILQRMRDLSVQATNTGGLNDDAKGNIQSEIVQLKRELDRIASTTTFNGKKLLDGSFSANFQVGANAGETIGVNVATAMGASGLGVGGVDVTGSGKYTNQAPPRPARWSPRPPPRARTPPWRSPRPLRRLRAAPRTRCRTRRSRARSPSVARAWTCPASTTPTPTTDAAATRAAAEQGRRLGVRPGHRRDPVRSRRPAR